MPTLSCPSPESLAAEGGGDNTLALLSAAPREQLIALLRHCAAELAHAQAGGGGGNHHYHRTLAAAASAEEAELPECEAVDDTLVPPDPEFYMCVATVVFLIVMAGLMAGCTMGILSLDPLTLKLKQSEGEPADKVAAEAVLGILQSKPANPAEKPRSRRHHMLVALLLCNALANEALPIFLDRLVSAQMAVLLSVTCVLVFGEILPSAIMTGPAQLRIAAMLAPLVGALMWLTAPLSIPIAWVLDTVIGDHDGVTRFKRNEFKAIVKMQARAKGWARRTMAANAAAAQQQPSHVPAMLSVSRQSSGMSTIASSAASPFGGLPSPFGSPVPKDAPADFGGASERSSSTRAQEGSERSSGRPSRTPAELRRQLSDVLVQTRKEREQQDNVFGASLKKLVSFGGGLLGKEDEGKEEDREASCASSSSATAATAKSSDKDARRRTMVAQPPGGEHGSTADTEFSDDEVTILHAVFSLQSRTVKELLEPGINTFEDIKMLPIQETMDLETMTLISRWGVSRIPIYDGPRGNIRGSIIVKEHLALDPDDKVPISKLKLRTPVLMSPDTSMFDALNVFQTGRSHLALVTPYVREIEACWRDGTPFPEEVRILGLCTIEDVIEELIGEEIVDEFDVDVESMRAASPQTEAARAVPFGANDPLLVEEGTR